MFVRFKGRNFKSNTKKKTKGLNRGSKLVFRQELGMKVVSCWIQSTHGRSLCEGFFFGCPLFVSMNIFEQ
jgi:hypothetical protein